MKLWAEVYDANETLIGNAPITQIESASITRALDGVGQITIQFPASDEQALQYLSVERRVRLYWEWDGRVREIGRGILNKKPRKDSANGASASVSGNDSLHEMTRRSVLFGRTYSNETIQAIADDLVSLVPGWTAIVDTGAGNQTARFDGTHVLKALRRVAEEKGFHLREGTDYRTVEIGAFGDIATTNGREVRAIKAPSVTRDLLTQDHILLIENIGVEEDSKDVVNWIVPFGAGTGLAALTLKEAYVDGYNPPGYTIFTTTSPDGRTLYGLKNDDSIATYGEIQRHPTFKEIVPVSNSDLGKTLSSKALADAAAAWLNRYAYPLTTYSLSVRKNNSTLRPGDKVYIKYRGFTSPYPGKDVTYIDVDGYFWVMKITEQFRADGHSTTLEISSVDRHKMDTAAIVVDVMEKLYAQNVSIQTFPVLYLDSDQDTIQGFSLTSDRSYKEAEFTIKFDSAMTDIINVSVEFESRPLYSLTSFDDFSAIYNDPFFSYIYQVFKDDDHPENVRIYINGIDRTTELGGPWGTTSSAFSQTKDITTYLEQASGGLYQAHTIKFSCSNVTGNAAVLPAASWNDLISHGWIRMKTRVLGTARAIIPE